MTALPLLLLFFFSVCITSSMVTRKLPEDIRMTPMDASFSHTGEKSQDPKIKIMISEMCFKDQIGGISNTPPSLKVP